MGLIDTARVGQCLGGSGAGARCIAADGHRRGGRSGHLGAQSEQEVVRFTSRFRPVERTDGSSKLSLQISPSLIIALDVFLLAAIGRVAGRSRPLIVPNSPRFLNML